MRYDQILLRIISGNVLSENGLVDASASSSFCAVDIVSALLNFKPQSTFDCVETEK